jgi:D-alanine-D-alanine ligase
LLYVQLCDNGWMNNPRAESQIIGYLEMLDVPFTGSNSKTISITYDKYAILEIAESLGIPIPKTFYIEADEELEEMKTKISFPAFVKPSSTDGSFGITEKSVCRNPDDIDTALKMIRDDFGVDCPILVQEFLDGRDINVGVLGYCEKTGEPRALPITEEDYSALPENLPKILGFESKWDPESPYWNIKTRPTTLSKEAQDKVIEWSIRLFRRLEIKDYCRFDWRLDNNGKPHLIEANPNCGWCWDGHLTKTANLCDIDYSNVLKIIMESALYRREKVLALRARPRKIVSLASQKAPPVATTPGYADAQK